MKKSTFLIGLTLIASLSCNVSKYSATNKLYKQQAKKMAKNVAAFPLKDSFSTASNWVGTTNFSQRKPNFVIIHHTAQNSCEQTLQTFTLTRTQVSAHYVICKDGTIYHMLNDYLRAHHAGVSKWGNTTDLNSCSIGIELDNNGAEEFSEQQINSLLLVLNKLKKAFSIPQANFIGHADIAPGRKVDPNKYFPWQTLANNGFGYWYDTTGIKVPENFDALQTLRIIGYNITNPKNALQSFKLHFMPQDSTKTITESNKKVLVSLLEKYL